MHRLDFKEVRAALRKAGKYAGEAQIQALLDAADKNNLEYLSITKGEPIGGYIYYVIVEVYPTNAGLMNHQRIYGETSGTEKYKDVFSKLRSVAGPYFVSGATQRHSVFKLVPSKNH